LPLNPADMLRTLHLVKAVLICLAVLLIAGYWLHQRLNGTRGRWPLDLALIVLSLVSVGAYFDFGHYPKFRSFMNCHDMYHYYLGSKYSREVGYQYLYQCTLLADWELMNQPKEPRMTSVRRMDDYSFQNGRDVIRDPGKYKAGFTPERWEEFKQDCRYFATLLRESRWKNVVRDMGYNATPVWNMVARRITSIVPTSSPFGMDLLVSFDLILIAIMTVLAAWAFGWRNALLALIFFCTCFCMSYTHIRGGLLRLDWVTMLVMSLCLLKKARYKTAGALMGYAGMARIFPLVFVVGLGGKFLWDLVRTRKLNRNYLAFFMVFGAVCAILMSLSIWSDGGVQHWAEFSKKIALHNDYFAPPRVGFRNIFLMAYDYPPGGWRAYSEQAHKKLEDWRLLWLGIRVSAVLLVVYLAKNVEDYETIPLGYIPAYFLTAPTFYYHVMLIAALFLFLPKRDQVHRLAGLLIVFLYSVAMFYVNRSLELDLTFAFSMACVLLVIALYMFFTAAIARPAPAPLTVVLEPPPVEPSPKTSRDRRSRNKRRS
jgi:hypothetical protein